MEKLNELSSQSISKPIESDGGQPFHTYSTITDKNGNGVSIVANEFEETTIKVLNFKEFNRQKFKKTPPFEDDIISNSDYVTKSVQDELADMDEKGEKLVKEDVAMAGGGNVSGMGAVVTSQPSSIPGNTSGATTGSGDIGAGQIASCRKLNRKNSKTKKSKVKKFNDFFKQK